MEAVSEVEVQKDKCRKESKRTRVEVEMQNAEIENPSAEAGEDATN
jgi:hypothetical protein